MKDLTFWIVFLALSALVWVFDKKYYMLRDNSTALPRPFSFSRVQLAWWTVIVIASFVSIIIARGASPTFDVSTLYLLGISSATTVGATLIDINDENNPNLTGLSQDIHGDNFFLDILSDKNGINVHRFQTVAFNIIFGIWFITYVNNHIGDSKTNIDAIMPVISPNNLILLGVSSGLYAALKTTENKQATADPNQAEIVQDEAKTLG